MTKPFSVAFKQKMVQRLTGKQAISASQLASLERRESDSRTCRAGSRRRVACRVADNKPRPANVRRIPTFSPRLIRCWR